MKKRKIKRSLYFSSHGYDEKLFFINVLYYCSNNWQKMCECTITKWKSIFTWKWTSTIFLKVILKCFRVNGLWRGPGLVIKIFFLKNVDFSPRGNQRIQNLKEFFKIEYKKEKLKLLPRKSKNKFWSPHNNKKIASKHWKHNIMALIIFVCLEKTIFSEIYTTSSTILFKSSILKSWF